MLGVNRRGLWVGLALLVASVLAYVMTPREHAVGAGAHLELDVVIPKSFGEWTVDENVVPVSASPDVEDNLNRIYSQILSRTYINRSGQRVMLSIAYGSDQRKATQVHRPEVCYKAQGFSIDEKYYDDIAVNGIKIPVMRLVSHAGDRVEPITYWIRVGNFIVRGGLEQKLAGIKVGLNGKIPDGLLFRVSSIGGPAAHQFMIQGAFIDELFNNLAHNEEQFLIGSTK